jgi:HTH-type transcriptional regulator / antitoxin HipB
MRIRTALELGALIRDARMKKGLDQGSLAREVGVSRQWVVAIEKGKPRAPIGLVLRTLNVLGISIEAVESSRSRETKGTPKKDVDMIDHILRDLQDKKR